MPGDIIILIIKIIWCLVPEIWSMLDRIFLSFWIIFLLFTTLNNPENLNFEKTKKHLEMLFYTCVS